MKSIRVYLVLVLLSTVCLVNFTAALHGYRSSMAQADQLLDDQLLGQATSLSKLAVSQARLPANLYGDGKFYQVWHKNRLVSRSNNAPNEAMVENRSGFHSVNANGFRWRMYVHQRDETYTVVVAERYDLYTQLIERMVLGSIMPIIWVLPLLAVFIWVIVRLGLGGLKDLSAGLLARQSSDLQALSTEKYPAELAHVVLSINQLLHRLGEAFEREQRFAADAAHELRTPLAAIKVSLHNLQQTQPKDSGEIADLNVGIDRMNHSIEQILSLYRLTPEKFKATRQPCNVTALTRHSIADMYELCNAKNQRISLDTQAENLSVQGDEFALMSVLRNLIDNACKYTPNGGEIHIALTANNQTIHCVVEDSGSGIPAQDYQRALNRFYRVGGDQHASGVVGSGLGLSIVNHIVSLHKGRIRLAKSAQLGGLAVHIDLPQTQEEPV